MTYCHGVIAMLYWVEHGARSRAACHVRLSLDYTSEFRLNRGGKIMTLNLAYLSQGKLFLKTGDLPAQQIESPFGQEAIDRALQRYQRREWKARGQGSPFGGSMLWGVQDGNPQAVSARITGVTSGTQEGQVTYALETEGSGGLFLYDWVESQERHLVRKEHFYVRDLNRHPELGMVVCSQRFPNGTANIGIVEGYHVRMATEGDSVDEAPAWIPGNRRQILFQSAGVARNAAGYPIGFGPFTIERLDLENATMSTLLDDPAFDYLLPHMDTEGTLYFIRRPYERPGYRRYSILQLAGDILLFPYRMLRAIFHFLNFFSLTFSRKPLTTDEGPKMEGPDERMVMLRGRMIDAEKALRESARKKEAPSLVPASWELVSRLPSGDECVLAKHVTAFDLDLQGNIIYTNGSAVYQLEADGGSKFLFKGKLIEDLVIVR